jgi:hypothetical protein
MAHILSAKGFNKMQNDHYTEYCTKCKANGVVPETQSKYFPTVPVKYGYVRFNSFGEHTWKKRKSDFN